MKIYAKGRNLWLRHKVVRISNDEMKGLMKQVVNRLYTFFIQGDNPRFQKTGRVF